MGYMKVVRRRFKRNEPCDKDWRNHDENQRTHIIKQIGCKPIHWKVKTNEPNCSNLEKYRVLSKQLYRKDGYMPPCRSIETLMKKVTGKTGWRICLGKNHYDITVYLDEQSHYEEAVFLPAYSFQSLIGNAGKCTIA